MVILSVFDEGIQHSTEQKLIGINSRALHLTGRITCRELVAVDKGKKERRGSKKTVHSFLIQKPRVCFNFHIVYSQYPVTPFILLTNDGAQKPSASTITSTRTIRTIRKINFPALYISISCPCVCF